jgi:hypothetical protein
MKRKEYTFAEPAKQCKRRKIVRFVIILAVLICVALAIVGAYLYHMGFRLVSWTDAHPSQRQVKKWTIEKFNPVGYEVWNVNPELNDVEFDTGLIENSTLMVLRSQKDGAWQMKKLARNENAIILAPKEGAWGIIVYGWTQWGTEEYIVNAGRIQSKNGIYKIYTKINQLLTFGDGRIIQGWQEDEPQNTPWHSPLPVLIHNKDFVLKFKVKINQIYSDPNKKENVWQMMSASTVLTSPKLDKPLAIDLAFYVNQSVMYSHVSPRGYHYQRMITRNKNEAFGKWKTYTLNYNWFINDALKRFHIEYAADTLQIESIEILSETMYGECEFEVDNLYLYYKDRQK